MSNTESVSIKTKKTNRKNKTNQHVNWMSGYFTNNQMMEHNPDFIKITLRVRIKNAIDNGIIAEIGTMHSGKGRPKKIYTTTPVSKDVLEQASAAGVQLYNQYNTVTVVNVDTASNATNTETETENETVDVSDKVNA